MRKYILAALAAAVLALVTATTALAVSYTTPTGNYSIRPGSGTSQSIHFTATFNPSNYNTRAVDICSAGGATVVNGPWVTGTGNTSSAPNCNDLGLGHLVGGDMQYRQSSPLTVNCWVTGEPHNGSC